MSRVDTAREILSTARAMKIQAELRFIAAQAWEDQCEAALINAEAEDE
jgi:hypothetical protein